MDLIFATLPPLAMLFAILVAVLAGFIKGATGFALPMIMISGLATVLPPNVAIATIIIPTLISNGWQVLRGGGVRAAGRLAGQFKMYIAMLLVFIIIAAQLVAVMPQRLFLLMLGVPIVGLALLLLSGRTFNIAPRYRGVMDALTGAASGFLGGLAGIWGPLTVCYLTALETPKSEQIRISGVIFGIGSIVLTFAHWRSGILNAQTLPLSLFMILPVLVGQGLGNAVQDRLDQQKFRKLTLLVLIIAGLNLIRRGLM